MNKREPYHYLPFARLLQHHIELKFGVGNKTAREATAKLLGVPYMTLSSWVVGNTAPTRGDRDRVNRYKLGVFFGWATGGDDEEGLAKTDEYFLGGECRSSDEERAAHIRARKVARNIGRKKYFQKKFRRLKKARKRDER